MHQIKTIGMISIFACLPAILQGCAAVAVGGAAAGASVATDARTAGTYVEDQAIELKAKRALLKNKALNKQVHINFTSYNTNVLVSGEAPTEALRQQVIDIVKNIEKVGRVYNEVILAAPSSLWTRSGDTTLTARVKTKLLAEKYLDGINIKIVTENGTVFLMGIITRADADRATEIARTTGGVERVVKLFEYTD